MSTTDDIGEAHWRAVGTVAITVVLTLIAVSIGIAFGYNLAIA